MTGPSELNTENCQISVVSVKICVDSLFLSCRINVCAAKFCGAVAGILFSSRLKHDNEGCQASQLHNMAVPTNAIFQLNRLVETRSTSKKRVI